MVITYFGNGTLRLQSGETSVLIDPEGNRMKGDVVLYTSATIKEGEVLDSESISFPGEYELHGVEVDGMALAGKGDKITTAYMVRMEDIRVGIIGPVSELPTGDELERMEEPDILILPIAKGEYLSGEQAAKLAKQLEPSVVIPTYYKSPAEAQKAFEKKTEPQEKFVCKKKDLIGGKVELIILSSAK